MLTALRGQKLPPEWIHIASPGDIPSWVKGKGIEDQLWRRKGLQIASKGHNWFEATVAMSAFKCMSQSQLRHVCLLSISDMSYFFFWLSVVIGGLSANMVDHVWPVLPRCSYCHRSFGNKGGLVMHERALALLLSIAVFGVWAEERVLNKNH